MDEEQMEEAAEVENDVIAGMQRLVDQFGYTQEDLERMVRDAVPQ